TAIRGVTQAGGRLATLPKSVTRSAGRPVSIPASPKLTLGNLKIGTPEIPLPIPNLTRVSEAGPFSEAEIMAGNSPEDALAVRASEAARKAETTITTQRLQKTMIIGEADKAGIRIPLDSIKSALRDHLAS